MISSADRGARRESLQDCHRFAVVCFAAIASRLGKDRALLVGQAPAPVSSHEPHGGHADAVGVKDGEVAPVGYTRSAVRGLASCPSFEAKPPRRLRKWPSAAD